MSYIRTLRGDGDKRHGRSARALLAPFARGAATKASPATDDLDGAAATEPVPDAADQQAANRPPNGAADGGYEAAAPPADTHGGTIKTAVPSALRRARRYPVSALRWA